jgi:hypothetical protein
VSASAPAACLYFKKHQAEFIHIGAKNSISLVAGLERRPCEDKNSQTHVSPLREPDLTIKTEMFGMDATPGHRVSAARTLDK